MGRFSDPYGDDDRLPEGITCTGYDADSGRRFYVDSKDGSKWVGAPYVEYGVLKPLGESEPAEEASSVQKQYSYQAKNNKIPSRKSKVASRVDNAREPPIEKVSLNFVLPELDFGSPFSGFADNCDGQTVPTDSIMKHKETSMPPPSLEKLAYQ
ncbi:hypothetical protein BDZ97DRAFT_2076672 [Flammula alnicola]|nr:hypothetical protein BDZ97DRAFT_2076672 [Flammula alnicola]